jgi:type IV secretory pathway VirB2 component (pilin)
MDSLEGGGILGKQSESAILATLGYGRDVAAGRRSRRRRGHWVGGVMATFTVATMMSSFFLLLDAWSSITNR